MKLRHDHPALQSGDLKEVLTGDNVFAFSRKSADGAESLLVVLNSSAEAQSVVLTNAADGGLPNASRLTEIFAMEPQAANAIEFAQGTATIIAPPQSLTVYQVQTR